MPLEEHRAWKNSDEILYRYVSGAKFIYVTYGTGDAVASGLESIALLKSRMVDMPVNASLPRFHSLEERPD